MKRIRSTLLVIAILCFISSVGCQTTGFGQPNAQFGGGQIFQNQNTFGAQPGFDGGPSIQGFQNFGRNLGQRFSNGFLNQAVNGVVNLAWRAVGL